MLDRAPLSTPELLIRAARGAGKVDRDGQRGITNVTEEEIEALVLFAVLNGLVPVWPGHPLPEQLVVEKE